MSRYDIFQATLSSDKDLVKKLLKSGVDINSINLEGKTPLLLALENQNINVDFVRFLIDEGADIHFRNQVKSSDSLIAEKKADGSDSKQSLNENSKKRLELLDKINNYISKNLSFLKEPINVNILKSAIESENIIKVEFVLNYEIDVIYKNQLGLGALYDFCSTFKANRSEKMLKCLSLLLSKGCRDFGNNGFGETAIRFLANYGHLEAVKMLIEYGDSIEALNWSENHQSVIFSDLKNLKDNLNLFFDKTEDQLNRTPLMLFLHFRNANEIKEIFNCLNMNDFSVNDIKKSVELLVEADKFNELKEVLNYFPVNKEDWYNLLMLSRMYKSSDCIDFLINLNSSLNNEKIMSEKELIENVKKVFKGVKLNGGMGLKCAESFDAYEYDKIDNMLEEEEDWQNISFEELEGKRGGIRYFDSKGLLFHLPAYIICDLSGKLGSDLIGCFTSETYDQLTDKFLNFNYEQMEVVTCCFEFFQEREAFNLFKLQGGIDLIDKRKIEIYSFFNKKLNSQNDEIALLMSNLRKILNTKMPLSQKNFTGKWNVWYENGVKKYESEYRDGKQHGKEVFWFSNGAIKEECDYKEGIINGKIRSWYSNGALQSEGEYKDGRLINKFASLYLSGAKRVETEFNDEKGNPNGKTTYWHENGSKEKEIEYIGQIPHGKYLKWDKTGKVLIDQEYKDGVMIKDNLASKK